MGDTVVIHLIRHEKTQANIERKYIGWTDEPIIRDHNQFILPIQPKKVYGSDLIRCEQTSRLYFPDADYEGSKGLRELDFGDFEMKTYYQIKDNIHYQNWIDSPRDFTPPNGESFESFRERILSTIFRIVTQPSEYTFVVHGGVVRLLRSLFGPDDESFQQISVNHREILTLTWANVSNLKGGQRCESLLVEPIMVKEIS
ncbi:histidine phosphatase family protein [Ureibacillus sp. NPDC094379]